jgi:signal transduction histidine kinase
MVEMLDAILMVSKAESGKLPVQATPIDVDAFCGELAASLEESAAGQHTIAYERAGDWTNVRLDPKHLRHILTNLVSNAIKYTPGGGAIRLRLRTDGDAGIFEVSDPGIGIPEADLGRLFQSFQRGTNVAAIAGTGLGLAIVKHSVDACGGTIDVESKVGKGTTVRVRLPLDRAKETTVAQGAA